MRLVILLLSVLPFSLATADPVFEKEVWTFFENNCLDCHDDSVAKGGLDLTSMVDEAISDKKAVELWTLIHDRVEHGEMPPKKKPRPDAQEMTTFLAWIEPRLTAADQNFREVVHRRLNREEYENTLNDLLGIETEVKDLLPPDQSLGGFDNNGEALAISPELFLSYLEAARKAIDSAIYEQETQPELESFTKGPGEEIKPYLGKQFATDGTYHYTFLKSRGNYSKISSRRQKTKHAGRYRVKFSARTRNSETPITFSAVVLDHTGITGKAQTVGFFEAANEPREFEFEVDVRKNSTIQIFTHDLPLWVKDPKFDQHAAAGFSDFEWTGPLYESWPPKSHQKILGDTDLNNGTLADAETALRNLMPKAWRRPVTDQEVARVVSIVQRTIDAGRPFSDSIQVGLEAVLCSPNLIFLTENSQTKARITHLELASRLSYFLWNSTPDETLLNAASAQQLDLNQQIDRMLSDEKSMRMVENFTGQWLKLREIDATTPDSKLYSDFDEVLQVSMVAESHAFFAKLLADNLSITNFIDSDFAMLNRRLAKHYGIDGVSGFEMQAVDLPDDSVRGGVLTQAAVLKVTANGTNTSPVMRGVWVLENILGKHIQPPPPNIEGIEPDIREATTIREQLDLHRDVESCAGCHQYIDPPGFALESFDPTGAFRENYLRFHVSNAEKGWGSVVKAKPVDASGQFADGTQFQNFNDFKNLLSANIDQFAHCLTERLATYALGREMGFSDRAALHEIVEKTKAEGNGLRTLIRNLILSPLFSKP